MKDYLKLIEKYGLNEVKEQKDFLTNPEFEKPNKPLVLAGGTGFGKTFTTILKLIMFYNNPENKGKKTIILPSSTKVLRDNFGDSLSFFKTLPFTYCVANGKREFNNAVKGNCDIIIVLPQTLANIKTLPKVEWLVVDEAHKWYFAKTIETIISKCNPEYQLLLTGTPFKFNARKDDYLTFYVPIEDMIAAGNIGNPMIEVVSSSVNLRDEDYEPSSNMVRNNLVWSYKEDKDSLVQVAKEINKTLKTRFRTTTIGRLLGVFGIDKTIIYCYSKKQARHFYKTFQSSDLKNKVLISNSEDDIDSTEFAKFKNQEQYRVLLVVDRGREGFDMPELFNIIDFTLSNNPEVILQILGRVFRISKEQPNKQKMYYKVASMNTAPFVLTLMTGILQLAKREYYETFTGKFSEIKVPVMPIEPKEPKEPREPQTERTPSNTFNTRALRYFQEVNIPLTADFWNQLKFKQGDIWKTMGQTTLQQVLSEMAGKNGGIFRTKEWAKERALPYSSPGELFQKDGAAYTYILEEGWMGEFYPGQYKPRNKPEDYPYEICEIEAKKYSSKGEFGKKGGMFYHYSLKNEWLKDWFPENIHNITVEKIIEYLTDNKIKSTTELRKKKNSNWVNAYKEFFENGLINIILKDKAGQSILQYTEDGKFVAEYDNANDAKDAIGKPNGGADIRSCAKGKRNSAYGYIWKFKTTDNFKLSK